MAAEKNIVGKRPVKNEYLEQYFEAHDLHEGDTWVGYEYMFWIDAKHDAFDKLMHRIPRLPYNDNVKKQFIQWLREEVQRDKQGK